MDSPLGPALANAFLCFYEKKWLEQCPDKFKPVYYRRYVDDIFVLFKSRDHLIKFREYLNKCHPNMNFFFYLGFLSRSFTNHRTAGEGIEKVNPHLSYPYKSYCLVQKFL